MFIWPVIAILMFFAIFPLVVSLWLSFSRVTLLGGINIEFIGTDNYAKIFSGSQSERFLGFLSGPSIWGWVILGLSIAGLLYWLVRYTAGVDRTILGMIMRTLIAVMGALLIWLLAITLTGSGRPGSLVITLIFVYLGIAVQYLLGLGLAILASNITRGKRLFRVVFLIPLMITPIGIAYTFRMMTDSIIGPLAPIFGLFGLQDFAWIASPWGARIAIIIADSWQWTPFMFITLLSALASQPQDPLESAKVDGANRFQSFWYITLPAILPISTALLMIRMIEAYKIIDLPRILTGGGPGLATQSLALHAYDLWRALDVGVSSAVGYVLLVVVTGTVLVFVNLARRKVTENV